MARIPPNDRQITSDDRRGWLVSVLFWLCLLVSVSMYAAVALSPKLLSWATLKDEHFGNQVRLVELEQQVKYLGRVVDALEHEPEFAAQLARVEFDAARPGDERITVDQALSLDGRDELPPKASLTGGPPWYVPLLRQFSDRPEFRRALLTIAAALAVFSFTFLQEPEAIPEKRSGRYDERERDERPVSVAPASTSSWLEALKRRYRT